LFWAVHAPNVKDIQFSMKRTVLLIAQLDQTTMVSLALLVLPHKDGTELNVLTDVTQVKSGMLLHKAVSVQVDNSGTDMLVLSVQVERPGTSTLNLANVQFHQPGTELLVLFVLEEEFITMLPTNVNAQADKLTMVTFVQLTAQLDNSTMKLLRNVLAHQVKTGTETSVSFVMAVKLGTQP
jgi:hypothetical protein